MAYYIYSLLLVTTHLKCFRGPGKSKSQISHIILVIPQPEYGLVYTVVNNSIRSWTSG